MTKNDPFKQKQNLGEKSIKIENQIGDKPNQMKTNSLVVLFFIEH